MPSPNVTVLTPARNAAGHLDAYRSRFYAIDWPMDALRLVIVEGDSTDSTPLLLEAWSEQEPRLTVVTCNMDKPHYGSVVNAERFRTLATVFNAGLAMVEGDGSEYMLMLPVDVRYEPDLLRRLVAYSRDIIAPFVYGNGVFYDIWGFTQHGRMFLPFAAHMAGPLYGRDPICMDTVGCVTLVRSEVLAAGVRYTMEDVDRGLCQMARERGFTVWAAPNVAVYHGE